MSGGKVKVTALAGAYAFEGVSYGPFQASKETPFLLVPEALANALRLPLHPDEVKAREDAQAVSQSEGDQQELGRWNVSALVKEVATLTKERDHVQSLLDKTQEGYAAYDTEAKGKIQALTKERDSLRRELEEAKADWQKQRDSLLTDLADSLKREDALKAQLNQSDDAPENKPDAPTEQPQQGTPLVEGLPHADLLTAGGFDTMEKLAAGLVVADGETESPVQKIDGVGKKTLEAYAKAVADWQTGQGN